MTSNSEPEPDRVEISVKASEDTEIFLIDSSFNLKARGVGSLNEEVEPGLYKLKFKEGSLIREMHQTLEPGQGPVEVTSPSLAFASPAPMAATSTTREYHEEAAVRLSRHVHRRIAPGSQIFVFARVWTGGADSGIPSVENPTRGLSLHDEDGELLIDLERDAERAPGRDASSGCTVEVAPGTYRLRVRTQQWGPLEQAVVASPGWQTQVFLWQTDDDGGRVPELSGASVFLAPMGAGFSADGDDVRATEVARVALLDGRAFMPRHQLERMLASEVRNPMVGIYAAHALAAAGEADHDLLQKAVDVLTGLVDEHPDVEALRIFSGAETTYRYTAPPMLSCSWSLVVAASANQPELVPPGSLAARASTRLWGYGPWLIWMGDALDGGRGAGVSLDVAVSRIASITSSIKPDELKLPQVATDLNDVEEALLSIVTPQPARPGASQHPELAVPTGAPSLQAAPSSLEGVLAARLGVPPAVIEDVAANLLSKLDDSGGSQAKSGEETPSP